MFSTILWLRAPAHAQPATVAALPVIPAEDGTPVELEGPIDEIDPQLGWIRVAGVRVTMDVLTNVESPTRGITRAELLGAPLPGRVESGFDKGRAILLGEWRAGAPYAMNLYVEPNEDLLAGPALVDRRGRLLILGRRVELIEDHRMRGIAINEVGFTIDPATIQPGTAAVAGGYVSGGVFYAFEIVSDFARLLPDDQTIVTRATCDGQGRLELRGASTDPDGTILVFDGSTGLLLGDEDVNAADGGGYGEFRVRIENLTDCPSLLYVFNSNGSDMWVTVE